jgi:lipid-binding SYLF domain-containing protein
MTINPKRVHLVLMAVAMLSTLTVSTFAQNKKAKEVAEAAKTAQKATKAVNEIMAIADKSIPKDLLNKAKAVGVFPNVIKAAFIFGGRGGMGLITRRLKTGWSAPAMFKLGGGSVGFQIGGSSTDVIMLFMTEDSLTSLLGNKFEIGGEAAAAAGPVGRTARATTDAQMKAQILSYSRSKGLFAGISLSGAVISPDNDANQALYGFDAKDLLTGENKVPVSKIPPATKGFRDTLSKYSR